MGVRVTDVDAAFAAAHTAVVPEVLEQSTMWAVWHDEALVYVGGVVQFTMLGAGRGWLVVVNRPPLSVLRMTPWILDIVRKRFPALEVWCNEGKERRFAEWAGFTFRPDGQWMRGTL